MSQESRKEGYETVAASQTAQVLGVAGAAGDFLARIVIGENTGAVSILDGATTLLVIDAGTPSGSVEIGAKCVTAWKITTAAATTVLAVGRFT